MSQEINTIEEAFKSQGLETQMPTLQEIPEKYRDAVLAAYQLMVINDAVNENIEPNWEDSSELKYEPYFRMASEFAYLDFVYINLNSIVGSRLCFHSRDKAKHAATVFKDVYKRFMLK